MNIFFRELRANFRSLLIWGGVSVALIVLAISKFSAYEGNPEMLEVLDSMPPALIDTFQMNTFNLTTITGFYGVMFIYFSLIATISAAMWGSDVISKEERDKTVEFTLTLPVTRQKLITSKILAALVNCILLLLIIWGASLVAASQYEPGSAFYDFLALSMVALFIIQMVFLAVGFFLGCSMKQYKRAGAVAVSILLGTYFLSIISGLNENLEFLKYFSPFTYFNPVTILNESTIEFGYVLLSLAIIAILTAGGYVTYARRDLYI
ncbi:MAG: ABC transporter permease subunit [Chloroflexota bacterium]|nr:MAG: ABC transporter permease subunit [Chloroflexota bacterium]